jgi:replicative DNA helicase
MQIRTKARRLQAEHGLNLIVIDYLQLMESSSKGDSDNRVQEVAAITRGLKGIARELNIPVIALSQLARSVEQSTPNITSTLHDRIESRPEFVTKLLHLLFQWIHRLLFFVTHISSVSNCIWLNFSLR